MSVLVRAPKMILGGRRSPLDDGYVWVDGSDIKAVGTGPDPAGLPEVTERLTYSNATLLPGLIDAHCHVTLPGDRRTYEEVIVESDETLALVAVQNMRRHLAAGVTTARDNGARNRTSFAIREGQARGYFPGPRLLVAGRPITPSGGHFHWCNGRADGTDEIRRVVRELVAEGADHIKIMASGGGTVGIDPARPTYSTNELRAAVETAHDVGVLTTAHCRSRESMGRAVDAGLDCIEHAEFLVPAAQRTYQKGVSPSGRIEYDEGLGARLLEAGTYVSFTLQAGGFDTLARLREQPLENLTEVERGSLHRLEAFFQEKLGLLSRLIDNGFLPRLVVSSDAGPFDTEFGRMHFGLELAVEAGMNGLDAIDAVTAVPAAACGISDRVGSIDVGKVADFVVVDGDPLANISAMRNVRAVFQAGARVFEGGR